MYEAPAPEALRNGRRFLATAEGLLTWPGGNARCAIGRSGVTPASQKREGDGASPAGAWPFRSVYYRPDRLAAPATVLPVTAIRPDMGWCDDPASGDYNREVSFPCPFGHERMWRDDGLYDIVVVLGYNDRDPVPGLGSAIFLHLAHADFSPTEGCIATDTATLLDLLAVVREGDRLEIAGGPS